MKKILLLLMLAGSWLASMASTPWNVPDETLHYEVRFKWGIIDANVGIATISTCNLPGNRQFVATLSGKSVDLLGHYYAATDKIEATIMRDPIRWHNSERITGEHGEFDIETITGNATGPSKDGPVVGHLQDGQVIRSRMSNYGSGITIDLLSVFYYMRQINYADFQPNQRFEITMSGHDSVEQLNITYLGQGDIAVNGTDYADAFHIALTFSGSGTEKVDTMDVWIANDSARIPLIVNGSLSVGHMECRFVDAQAISGIPGI